MSEKNNIDKVRTNTLEQIEKTERNYTWVFIGVAIIELAFFACFLLLADFSNRVHLLLFIASISIYTILASGLIALGIFVNRNTLRVLRAIELLAHSDGEEM
ncbi:MAG: hypothetical protein LC768_02790 [Acidobacteria bacterium]|nr:hypothetical protein [Acidobacteriota bacterium]MCA1637260.1 hypothetical protein [Acidobacteriota bacterium]